MDCYAAVKMSGAYLWHTADVGAGNADGRGLSGVCGFYEVKNRQKYIFQGEKYMIVRDLYMQSSG